MILKRDRDKVQETVRQLCDDHDNLAKGLKILNVGFGLGIVISPFSHGVRFLT